MINLKETIKKDNFNKIVILLTLVLSLRVLSIGVKVYTREVIKVGNKAKIIQVQRDKEYSEGKNEDT